MTTDSVELNSPTTPPLPSSRRWKAWTRALVVFLLVALACGLTYGIRRATAPRPPMMATQSLDPKVAEVLQNLYTTVNEYPRNGAAWGWLGTALMGYDFKVEARECFVHAEKLAPTDPRWPYFHGLTMFPDATPQGLEKLRRAVDLNQDKTSAARNRLAKILVELGFLDEAEPHFRRVQQRWPNDPDAVFGLGKVAYLRGDLEESLELIKQAATSRHTAKAARHILARIHQTQGNAEEARDTILEIQQLSDDEPTQDPFVNDAAEMVWTGRKVWLGHATRLFRQNRIDQALSWAEGTVQVYPEALDAWTILAQLRMRSEDFQKAQAAWKKTTELSPESVEAHMQLGLASLRLQQFERARNAFQKTINLNPNQSNGHHNLGLTLISLGQFEQSTEAFREAIRLRPTYFDSYLGLADALKRSGDELAAQQVLDEAIKVKPDDPRSKKLQGQL